MSFVRVIRLGGMDATVGRENGCWYFVNEPEQVYTSWNECE
jgi:hypothetical protein